MRTLKRIIGGTILVGLVALCGEGCTKEETKEGWHSWSAQNPTSFYHDMNGDGIDEIVSYADFNGGITLAFYLDGLVEAYTKDLSDPYRQVLED
jgi:hypothetical protein